MKRFHIDNIDSQKTYYEVCCGEISEIQIQEVFKDKNGDEKIRYFNIDCDFIDESFVSDAGIESPNSDYLSSLNAVFETKQEAEEFINNEEYQEKLKEHREWCNDCWEDKEYLFTR